MTELTQDTVSYESATCFDHLVDANLRFLRRELDRTPNEYGPLMEESDAICDEMVALCSELRAMTDTSQPAYVRTERRQRGYVTLYLQTDKEVKAIGAELARANLICVVTRVGAKAKETCLIWDERNDVSQSRNAGEQPWKGETFFNPHIEENVHSYDTAGYMASQDKMLVRVRTADDDWGYDAGHCITATHSALKRIL